MTSVSEAVYTEGRRIVSPIPGPRSQELARRRSAAVAGGIGSALPAYIESAGPGLLRDVDGNIFIDLGSGLGVTSVGNAAREVAAAAAEQAARLTHTCFLASPYEGYVAVCEQLGRLTPGGHEKRSVLLSTGAEAVENAVKVARSVTSRPAVVALDHAYHGRTNLAMALTAKNAPYKQGFGPFTPDVHRIRGSYPYRDPEGTTGRRAAQTALEALERHVGGRNVAAIIVEPVQGEGGFIVPAEGFLPEVARWCRESGALFVADEIQSGFCRTGRWFASEHEGLEPDLVVTAKALAGGLPLAGVTGRAEIMDAVPAGGLGGTFGGNPVSCAAALATIGLMIEGDLAGRAERIGEILFARLRPLAARHGALGDVRGRGAMVGVEIVDPATRRPDAQLAERIASECRRTGVMLLTTGTYGNVLRFLPALVIPETVLNEALDVIEECCDRLIG